MRVCLGGTFDVLHPGHVALLARAFEVGSEVFIGLTSDEMAQHSRERKVRSFSQRKRALAALLRRRGWKGIVSRIDHPFGRAADARYQGIAVSPETVGRVIEINRARKRKGLPMLKVFTIPFLYAEDGLRFSATRIREGEIDARGRRRTPVRVAVGTANQRKVAAVRSAFQAAWPKLRFQVRGIKVRSGVPEQPTEEETFQGAERRAERALAAWKDADYGVGVEAGLIDSQFLERRLDVQYVTVKDKFGASTASHGGGFYYPREVEAKIVKGRTVSSVLGPVAGDRRLGSTTGAIGFLSKGALDREELTRQAVVLALVPRISRDLYQE